MSRPTMKDDLLYAADEQFKKLWSTVDGISEEDQKKEFLFEDRDKFLRDVLAHLYEWHCMLQRWYKVGVIEGDMPSVPGEGYNWRTLPDLNLEIWKKYQDMSLETAKEKLKNSHKEIIKLILNHSNDELFSKKIYKWTKSSTLGAYFVSSTSSHYDWAMKKIRKQVKLLKKS